jgi:hypothetical protein
MGVLHQQRGEARIIKGLLTRSKFLRNISFKQIAETDV